MEIAFRHANPPPRGNESTLLTVTREGNHHRYLIDAGHGVAHTLGKKQLESLDGVFLTHPHVDHYTDLGRVLEAVPAVPVYASKPTAAMLPQVVTEADRYQELGDVADIIDALVELDGWISLDEGIDVVAVPAGHTPGAAGFFFRLDDTQDQNETPTVLVTGDFTTRPVAGYPGLELPDQLRPDVLITNAATTETFESTLSDALSTILERVLNGSLTVVAASALTAIHASYLLGYVAEKIDREFPICLVGQAAKLYDVLEYDVPSVDARAEFENPGDVLSQGAVTIAGPETPDQGSTERLFEHITDRSDATFVQLCTSSADAVTAQSCTTHDFYLSNHPRENVFTEFVEETFPRHLILKHVDTETGKELSDSFDDFFRWATGNGQDQVVYRDGTWRGPEWINPDQEQRILQRNFVESGTRPLLQESLERLPSVSWERNGPDPQAEGVDVESLVDTFEINTASVSAASEFAPQGDRNNPGAPVELANGERADGAGAPGFSPIDEKLLTDLTERIESLEATVDDRTADISTETAVEQSIKTVEKRLEALESSVEALPERVAEHDLQAVSGTVVRQEDLVLLRIDAEELEGESQFVHGQRIRVLLPSTDEE